MDKTSLFKKPFMNNSWYSHCYQNPQGMKAMPLNPKLAHPDI